MNWNQILNHLLVSETPSLGIFEITLTLALPFMLCLAIAGFYLKTNRSNHFNLEFIYSLLLFSSLTAIITLLIGSNIARAFGLVAALSLIRFRTALKSPLEAIYLFWALAVGMACGTGFYFAATLTVLMGILALGLVYFFRFGESSSVGVLLKIELPLEASSREFNELIQYLERDFKRIKRLNSYINSREEHKSLVLSAELNFDQNHGELIKKIEKLPQVRSLEIMNLDNMLFGSV